MSSLKWRREQERVGRVFIRSKKDGGKVQVESAYFSNLDFRWYDIDGNVHPLWESYQGSPLSIGFRIQNSDGKGNLEEYEEELKLACKIGERGLVTQQIISDGKTVIKDTLSQFSEQWGLKELVQSEWLDKMRYHVVSACFLPGRNVKDNLVANSFLPLWFFFDMLEDLHWPFDDLIRMSDVALSILRLEDDDPSQSPDGDPIMKTAVAAAKIFAETTSRRSSPEKTAPLIDALSECFEALCIKMSAEWQLICSSNSERMMATNKHLREITAAGVIAVEVLLLEFGYSVSSKVRSCFWYKMVMKSFIAHASNANDILSYQKEFLSNTLTNNIVWCHMRNGDSLKVALKKVMDMVESSYDDVQYFSRLLLDRFRGTADYDGAEKVLDVIRRTIDGHIHFYANVDRYHSDLVYDCVVDELPS